MTNKSLITAVGLLIENLFLDFNVRGSGGGRIATGKGQKVRKNRDKAKVAAKSRAKNRRK